MNGLNQDLRHAMRRFRKSPGFTFVAVFTLALAIGATTAIFSVVYGVLLRSLPYADPNRIMAIFEVNTRGAWNRLADPNFDDFRDQNHSFQAIAKYGDGIASVSGASLPTRSMVASVSPDFFNVFRVHPMIGRDFSAMDTRKGAVSVALVSYGYWKQYLGSSLDLSHSHLKIDNSVYSVIGVLPEGFLFPPEAVLWVPADLDGENPSRTSHNYSAVGRLRDGVTVAQANAEISAIARRIHDAASDQNDYLLKDGIVVPLKDSITAQARPAILILLGAVGFLLLVACANVANLLLAQASTRERELAIRSALGAARGRLIRQFLTEALLLSLVSGGFGVLAAISGVRGLIALAPASLPRLDSVSVNIPIFVFAFLLSTAVASGLGVFTAMRATSGIVRQPLAEGVHAQPGAKGSQRIGRGIVAAQIAITLVLVVGAGLLGRSLMNVLQVNPGFRIDKIVTMDVSLPWGGWIDPGAKAREAIFFSSLIDRLKQIPGVHKVGAASRLPMEDGGLPDGMFLLMTQDEVPKAPVSVAAARGILRELNPEIPPRFRTFSQVYSASLGSRRFNVILIGLFGIIALLLATAGVFGVMAYSVSQRTREIGVRVALGARKSDVLTMILSEGLRTVFVGIAIGVAGSLALTRTVESLLFGVTATDPLTFAAVILPLIATALLACYIPARRATKVDPMVALRYE